MTTYLFETKDEYMNAVIDTLNENEAAREAHDAAMEMGVDSQTAMLQGLIICDEAMKIMAELAYRTMRGEIAA